MTDGGGKIPDDLVKWLNDHSVNHPLHLEEVKPPFEKARKYILATINLKGLDFKTRNYNPRTPNQGKVRELQASISQLNMLSPLTCAFLESPEEDFTDPNNKILENVILIDGRHRFNALQLLAKDNKDWADKARIDIKVFFGLKKSDLHVLATYLNKTRRNLSKGEYFRAIVKIYEEKLFELRQDSGKPVTEEQVFKEIHGRELTDKNFDLSVGRIVGITAFDEEEDDSWYPRVGIHQNDKYKIDNTDDTLYCQITAGNLAELLRYLCCIQPYNDLGDKRSVEIDNTLRLGRIFRKEVLDQQIKERGTINHTTIGCKFWCIAAIGSLFEEIDGMNSSRNDSILAQEDPDWDLIGKLLSTYSRIMDGQAEIVQKYLDTDKLEYLKQAWSYQTTRAQVQRPLKQALSDNGIHFISGAAGV